MIKIRKKNGEIQSFNGEKIKRAIRKSADRVCVTLTDKEERKVVDTVRKQLQFNEEAVPVSTVHNMVEVALDSVNQNVAKSYRDFRDNKSQFAAMLDKVYSKKLSLNFIGDRSNANSDSALVTTQKAIVYNELNSELYKRFFLSQKEERAVSDGYLYIHDRGSRLDTMNCFSSETEFITSEGVRKFSDFKDGDNVVVLTQNGNWKTAVVHSYGIQKLNKISFKRGSNCIKTVFCTENHRWFLKDGTETTSLKVGDKLVKTPNISEFDWNDLNMESKRWWVYGFCFGDGSTVQHSTNSWCSYIRLFGHKCEYVDMFRDAGFTVTRPKFGHYDAYSVYIPKFRKSDISFDTIPFPMIGFFVNGWLCADGHRNLTFNSNSPFRGVQVTGSQNSFVEDLLNIAGYFTTRKYDLTSQITNYGKRGDTTFEYGFYSDCGSRTWVVDKIEQTERHEIVWCLDVEDDHGFVLKHGIPTGNCCIYDMKSLITGGFFMGNLDYMEPKSLDVAFDLVADVTLNAASSQYGGFTIPQVDKLLAPYAEKSYKAYYDEYMATAGSVAKLVLDEFSEDLGKDDGKTPDNATEKAEKRLAEQADRYAIDKVRREFEQGFQSWEMKFNSVASSRGDYPFTAITFGLGTGRFETMCSSVVMKVRAGGQGKPGFKHPVLFPKLSFFYDKNLHGKGKELEWLYDEAIRCSMKTMYPDFISLTGDGYAPRIYKKYGVPISRMGCVDMSETISVCGNLDKSSLSNVQIGDFFESVSNDCAMSKRDGRRINQWAALFSKAYGRRPTNGDVVEHFGHGLDDGEFAGSFDRTLFNMWDSYVELKTVDELKANGFVEKQSESECRCDSDFVRNKIWHVEKEDNVKQLDIYFPTRKIGFEVEDFATHSRSDGEPYVIDGKEGSVTAFKKGPSYFNSKREFFSNIGIDIHEIWEDEIVGNTFSSFRSVLGYTGTETKHEHLVSEIHTEEVDYIDLELVGITRYVKDVDGSFVRIKKVIKNKNVANWLEISLDNGQKIVVTTDHPFITPEGQTLATDLSVGAYLVLETGKLVQITSVETVERTANSYDIETESGTFVFSGIQSHNCRAQTSPWFERGGMEPADEDDRPVYDGRFNMGAISLHFSMIAAKAKKEDKDFFEVLDQYLEMARGIHRKTFEYLSHKKAGTNPLGFCQGGFYGGHKDPDEELGEDFLRPMTISFGIIGLNEASVLWTGKRIDEDNSWAVSVLEHINAYVDRIKKEDNILYAIYGTPGESLVATQVVQFKKKYGIVNGVSDRDYVTNSFHCPVYADITPIQKQDIEYPMFHLCNGGNIAYARMRSNYNFKAFKDLTDRAMEKGFYWGNNQQLDWCEKCGFSFSDSDTCPKCGSGNVTRIERMNGYLSYASVRGKTMYSDTKLQEFKERVSM